MRRLLGLLACVSLFLFLFACSSNGSGVQNGEDVESLHAELIMPDKVSVHEEYEFQVHVTEDEKGVNDADQVQFELWEGENKKESEFIEAFYDKNGIYSIKKTFSTDGEYTIQAHVEAHDKTVAPKESIQVGEASKTQ